MTDDAIALRALLEKGSDASVLREMIGFSARRLMELETDALCGAGFFAWINRNRRLAKDFEASIESVEAFLYAASSVIMRRTLAR